MNEYKDALGKFSERIKTAETQKPLQQVNPVHRKARNPEEEVQLMIWISKALMKRVKLRVLEENSTIKDITTLALKEYLDVRQSG